MAATVDAISETKPTFKLYSVQQVAGASFLGSPLAGSLLIASNYRKLGNGRAVGTTILLGILATGVLVAIAFALPEKFPNFILPVVCSVIMGGVAKVLQGTAYDQHIQRGGERASAWAVLGVTVPCLVVIGGGFLGYYLYQQKQLGTRLPVGSESELYYAKGVAEAEAQGVARVLTDLGYFTGTGRKTILMAKTESGFAVSFVVKSGIWDKADMISAFQEVGSMISAKGLGGRLTEVRLCDEDLGVRKVIPIPRPAKASQKAP